MRWASRWLWAYFAPLHHAFSPVGYWLARVPPLLRSLCRLVRQLEHEKVVLQLDDAVLKAPSLVGPCSEPVLRLSLALLRTRFPPRLAMQSPPCRCWCKSAPAGVLRMHPVSSTKPLHALSTHLRLESYRCLRTKKTIWDDWASPRGFAGRPPPFWLSCDNKGAQQVCASHRF